MGGADDGGGGVAGVVFGHEAGGYVDGDDLGLGGVDVFYEGGKSA